MRRNKNISRQNRRASGWQRECQQINLDKARRIRRQSWRKRIYVTGALVGSIYAGLVGWYVWQSGEVGRLKQATLLWGERQMVDAGLVVQRVRLSGQQRLSPQAVLEQAAIAPGTPIFALSLAELKARLEQHPHIAEAEIERELPGRLLVHIREREPAAIWQHQGKRQWLDHEGVILSPEWVNNTGDTRYPLLTGAGIQAQMPAFWQILEAAPELRDEIVAAQWVGGRRWNIWLSGDVKVMLPMQHPQRAMKQLAQMQQHFGLTDRAILHIDLRIEGKAFVRYQEEEQDNERTYEMVTAALMKEF